MALFRKQAIAHRYETGWARLEPDKGLAAWKIALAVVGNALVFAMLYMLVR